MKTVLFLTLSLFIAVGTAQSASEIKKIASSRNPFQFYDQKTRQVPRLEMIFISNNKRTALINGKEYQKGSLFGNSRIIEISIDHIKLSKNGKTRKVLIDEAVR